MEKGRKEVWPGGNIWWGSKSRSIPTHWSKEATRGQANKGPVRLPNKRETQGTNLTDLRPEGYVSLRALVLLEQKDMGSDFGGPCGLESTESDGRNTCQTRNSSFRRYQKRTNLGEIFPASPFSFIAVGPKNNDTSWCVNFKKPRTKHTDFFFF